jgi:hypothetical protein
VSLGVIVSSNNIKGWTVLIYANGNNELEPEIWKSKIDAEKSGSSENINVVMQIGRVPRHMVEIMRPKAPLPDEGENWTGVRRYYISNTGSELISDLGRINMADPRILYDFIKWGFESYPSKRRMLVVGGHGFSFVAIMTDFSQDVPYMMGVPQMCRTINAALKETGAALDILVLDACYMNSIEIIYELGKKKECPVKYLLTYIRNGPLSGLPCDKLVSALKEDYNISDTTMILKGIVDSLGLDLVAVEINHGKLKKIKGIISRLAYSYLTCEGYKDTSPREVIDTADANCPWYSCALEYRRCIQEITICYKPAPYDYHNLIDIAAREFRFTGNKMDYIALIYLNLSFCRNNCWTYLLTSKSLDKNVNSRLTNLNLPLEPIVMHPKIVERIISFINTSLPAENVGQIINHLFLYKNWTHTEIINRLSNQLKSFLP